jgi:imidazolonepropionase-like amidohydrolase
MRILVFILFLGCCAAVDLHAQAPSQPSALVLEQVNVVDVRTGRVRTHQTVVLVQGRIASVGPARSAKMPSGARVVDAGGKYLIPGLWDMHVHAAWPGIDGLFASLFVANGVTGVREMYGDKEIIRAWKARYESGEPWPRMIAAGHILDGPKPFWPGSTTVSTAEEARQAVDRLHAAGADFIKVYTRLPREAYVAAVSEAKRLGTYVAGHVPDSVTVAEASDLGQRSIEHLTGVALDCSKEADGLRAERLAAADDPSPAQTVKTYARQAQRILATQDSARCAALIKRLARNRTWQVPTLVVNRSFAFLDEEGFTADPRLRYMPEEVAKSWDWRSDFRFRERTPEDWAVSKRIYRRGVEIVGAMHRAGVPLLAGTDVINPFSFPGFSLHDELALLVEAGLSPAEALRTATLNPAIFFGETASMGTVEEGRRADLVLLDANPLENIGNTKKVHAVVLQGRFYDRATLDAWLAKADRTTSPSTKPTP